MNALIARALQERRDLGYVRDETREALLTRFGVAPAKLESALNYVENSTNG